tara:strand:+ start:1606 stop:1902 length:297 start_codon:yes stop_codon:yes gene_type:complete
VIKAYLYIKENAILFFIVLYFLFSVIIKITFNLNYFIPCLWKKVFGFECFSCGVTTSVVEIFKSNFFLAWEINKLTFFITPLLIYVFIKDFLKFLIKS